MPGKIEILSVTRQRANSMLLTVLITVEMWLKVLARLVVRGTIQVMALVLRKYTVIQAPGLMLKF